MDISELNLDVGKPFDIDLSEWAPDYNLLNRLSAKHRLTVADAEQVWVMAKAVAEGVGLAPGAVGAILQLEFSFPDRAVYRAAATRDDGSKLYRGITQASMDFWLDVSQHANSKGFKIAARRPENATLFEQIAAPFIYLDRYRKSVGNHLFTPAMVYTLHQQGPGSARQGFGRVINASGQSGRSLQAVRAAQRGAQGRSSTVFL